MNRSPQILTSIAREYLGIATLETRRSDRLDFHEVAVWQVEAALKAAFDAGRNTASQPHHQRTEGPVRFDDYEIQPCRRYIDRDEPQVSFVEPCEPSEADFWTLYGHIPGEGVQAVGDFDTRQHAEEVFARITGCPYTGASRNRRRGQP
jgi:hypothetical protein